MSNGCTHIAGIQTVTPNALGCEKCPKSGSRWLLLRICPSCGHVGWRYVDEVVFDLSNRKTPHNGRIPRYY